MQSQVPPLSPSHKGSQGDLDYIYSVITLTSFPKDLWYLSACIYKVNFLVDGFF